ncbi:Outer membrane porin protein [Ralstonia edaphis]|uniref:porin n=1 Tax=Ralstonia edaphi TaxID=3058599 RepID=UPI0028F4D296|nr:porin [Ralstonia sp. LMG 6871]CAJ0720848.1 Outer membrane porin protein [Ralstonia sp. LMG 6871]
MKRSLTTVAVLGTISAAAHAQSSVTLYGIVDVGIRYNTHQNAAGNSKIGMGNGGLLSGSRWGLMGNEDLGGGNKAFFQLESGFTPGTGSTQQSTPSGTARLFGRTAVVGLSSQTYGEIALGRQYTLVHEMVYTHDIYALSNYVGTVGYQGAGLTGGGRLDNTVRYTSPSFGGFTVKGAYTFGETAGDTKHNSSPAVAASYDNGPLSVGAAFQIINNIGGLTPATTAYGSTYFGITIPDSTQKVATVGATYKLPGGTKLYASYIYSNVYPVGYRNDSFSVAVSYPLTPALELKMPIYFDRLKHAGQNGTRVTGGPLLDYSLSKRTDVYAGVDYTQLNGAWRTLAGTPGFTMAVGGRSSVFEATVGLRHKF